MVEKHNEFYEVVRIASLKKAGEKLYPGSNVAQRFLRAVKLL